MSRHSKLALRQLEGGGGTLPKRRLGRTARTAPRRTARTASQSPGRARERQAPADAAIYEQSEDESVASDRSGTPALVPDNDVGVTSREFTLYYWTSTLCEPNDRHHTFGKGAEWLGKNKKNEYMLAAITVLSERGDDIYSQNYAHTDFVVRLMLQALQQPIKTPFENIQRLAAVCDQTPNDTIARIATLLEECIAINDNRTGVCGELQSAIGVDVSQDVWNAATNRVFGEPKDLTIAMRPLNMATSKINEIQAMVLGQTTVQCVVAFTNNGNNVFRHGNKCYTRTKNTTQTYRLERERSKFFHADYWWIATSLTTVNGEEVLFAVLQKNKNDVQKPWVCRYQLNNGNLVTLSKPFENITEFSDQEEYTALFLTDKGTPTVVPINQIIPLDTTMFTEPPNYTSENLSAITEPMAVAFFVRYGQPWYVYYSGIASNLEPGTQIVPVDCTTPKPLNRSINYATRLQQQIAFAQLRVAAVGRRRPNWILFDLETHSIDFTFVFTHIALEVLRDEGRMTYAQYTRIFLSGAATIPDISVAYGTMAELATPIVSVLDNLMSQQGTYLLASPDDTYLTILSGIGAFAILSQLLVFGCTLCHTNNGDHRLTLGSWDYTRRGSLAIATVALKTFLCMAYAAYGYKDLPVLANVAVQTPVGTFAYLIYFVLSAPRELLYNISQLPLQSGLAGVFILRAILGLVGPFLGDKANTIMSYVFNSACMFLYFGYFYPLPTDADHPEMYTRVMLEVEPETETAVLSTSTNWFAGSVVSMLSAGLAAAYQPPIRLAPIEETIDDITKKELLDAIEAANVGKPYNCPTNVAAFPADLEAHNGFNTTQRAIVERAKQDPEFDAANPPNISKLARNVYNTQLATIASDKALADWKSGAVSWFKMAQEARQAPEYHQADWFRGAAHDALKQVTPTSGLEVLYNLQETVNTITDANSQLYLANRVYLYLEYALTKKELLDEYSHFLAYAPQQLRYAISELLKTQDNLDVQKAILPQDPALLNKVASNLQPSWLLTQERPVKPKPWDDDQSELYSTETLVTTYVYDVCIVLRKFLDN